MAFEWLQLQASEGESEKSGSPKKTEATDMIDELLPVKELKIRKKELEKEEEEEEIVQSFQQALKDL